MNKVVPLSEVVSAVSDGERLAFGGGGLVRKPMAFASALGLARSSGLQLVAFLGGPEVDVLIGLGKVGHLTFAYVGLDSLGLAPNFRKAREAGELAVVEMSESTIFTGLDAAARRLPFLPSRSPLGTDLMTTETNVIKTIHCPFTGENLAAIPALRIDTAVIHVSLADRTGNAVIFGDEFADVLLAEAAERVFVTTERLVDELPRELSSQVSLTRLMVDTISEVPRGAGFTALYPNYAADFLAVAEYQSRATDRKWLQAFCSTALGA